MAATLYVEPADGAARPAAASAVMRLEAGALYWFLYRYFETANLRRSDGELIDLYGDRAISGYQLERLLDELARAREDATARPAVWRELVGWSAAPPTRAAERWQELRRGDALAAIDALAALARVALERGGALVAAGD